jgi:hypothetical protein
MIIKRKTKLQLNCDYINNKCIQECKCCIESKNSDNIIRLFDNNELYKWETKIYLKLVNSEIVPLINTNKESNIIYILNEYVSLRRFLKEKENYNNTNLILNELYSFINTFKKYNFVHGNLHIDNIFIKQNMNDKIKYDFKVIDYVNSYIKNERLSFYRTSFIGEYDVKNNEFLNYWDFFTIYISLNRFYKNKANILYNLHNIVESYIPINIFNNMLKETIIKKRFETSYIKI